ncbi:MAG: hypothetical protein IJR02_10855 [Bacteroidaceae bacterium]|nr:hypothetical protein [Bacteroidaceae bacterium]
MESRVRRRQHTTHPITHYWGLVKDMDNSQKLELVTMLIDSVRLYPTATDEDERERGFRNLAGCWANDESDDDIEAIIREGREGRRGSRIIPSFDE